MAVVSELSALWPWWPWENLRAELDRHGAHFDPIMAGYLANEQAQRAEAGLEAALVNLEVRGVPRAAVQVKRTGDGSPRFAAVAIDPRGFACTVDPVRWKLKPGWRWPP